MVIKAENLYFSPRLHPTKNRMFDIGRGLLKQFKAECIGRRLVAAAWRWKYPRGDSFVMLDEQLENLKPGQSGGFSLAEVLMATVVLGIGMAAIMGALRSGTQVSAGASDMSQAVLLAQELRERMGQLPFSDADSADAGNPPGLDEASISYADDLDDYNHQTFCPPISSMGDFMDTPRWSQTVDITWKNDNNIAAGVGDGASDTAYVKITIRHDGEVVLTTGWIVSRQPAN